MYKYYYVIFIHPTTPPLRIPYQRDQPFRAGLALSRDSSFHKSRSRILHDQKSSLSMKNREISPVSRIIRALSRAN